MKSKPNRNLDAGARAKRFAGAQNKKSPSGKDRGAHNRNDFAGGHPFRERPPAF
jgi:hypothetical protein